MHKTRKEISSDGRKLPTRNVIVTGKKRSGIEWRNLDGKIVARQGAGGGGGKVVE
jgi:hypothetical protein